MFDHLHVKAYGQSTPLGEVAQVTIKSPTMAIINVYDTEVQ
jgi:ribosome recycling factor